MKTVLLFGLLMSCALPQIVAAQTAPAPAKPAMCCGEMGMDKMPMPGKKDSAKPGMGMEGASMDTDKQMLKMQANIDKMQKQMEHIKMTADPSERAKLLDEHMRTMQENMQAMRGMKGTATATGAGKASSMGMDAAKPEVIKRRQDTIEKRLDMMQMMMEQMMQRDSSAQPMPHM